LRRVDPLSAFPTDENRVVRLTIAKLFTTQVQSQRETVLSADNTISGRLVDDEECGSTQPRCRRLI
jgi:hypothetical protein